MIVDDHELVRRGIRLLVQTRPYYEIVGEAGDGLEAIEVATRTKPDVAIIDYSLPHRNGLVLAETLKRVLPKLEIVLFTMHDHDEVLEGVIRSGVRGLVLKSDAEHQLLDALDAVSVRRPFYSPTISRELVERLGKARPNQAGALTTREREIVQLIAEGRVNKEVANCLAISVKTVETHRASAMRKLELRTTADLVRYAVKNNIASL
jgi:DNA-binding NarL/FixJ family response regulator